MVSIKCAHCKSTHVSVAQVRDCAVQYVPVLAAASRTTGPVYPGHEPWQAAKSKPKSEEPNWNWRSEETDRQDIFAADESFDMDVPARPKLTALRDLEHQVPAGRYAVGTKETKFYRIDKPAEGRWKGYTFVKVQASDDMFPIKSPAARQEVLQAIIAQGVEESIRRYGQEIGECGICGQTLTDVDSRTAGIGPICAGKMGW